MPQGEQSYIGRHEQQLSPALMQSVATEGGFSSTAVNYPGPHRVGQVVERRRKPSSRQQGAHVSAHPNAAKYDTRGTPNNHMGYMDGSEVFWGIPPDLREWSISKVSQDSPSRI